MKTNSPSAWLGVPLKRTLLLLLCAVFIHVQMPAATITWSGATNGWSTNTNWAGGVLPASGDSLVFDVTGAGGLSLNNNLTSSVFNIAGITFTANAGAYVIGGAAPATVNTGNAFVLTGSVINSSTALETINAPFSMTAVQTFNASAGSISLGGVVSGTGGIAKTGANTLSIAGLNSFSGGTTLSAGTLRVSTALALGTGALTVSGSSTLGTIIGGGTALLSNATSIGSGIALSLDGGNADLFLTGVISGAGSLKATSGGNVFLFNTANSFSGGTSLTGTGILFGTAIGNTGSNGSFGAANTITIASSSALGYLGAGETSNRNINFSTTNGGTFTNNAASSSTSALTLSSVTTANLSMGVAFNGGSDTVINGGITGNSSTLNFNKGGTGTLTVNGNISGTASNIRAQGGVLILNGSTTSNETIVTQRTATGGGVIQFGGSSAIKTTDVGTNNLLGGWATWNGTDWASGSGTAVVSFNGTYTSDTWAANNNTDVTMSSAPTSGSTTYSLRFNTAGAYTLTLTGTNVITSGGILVTSGVGANSSTITGGTLEGASSSDLVINNFNTAGGLTIASIIANNTAATVLTVTGPGTTTLTSAANTYTGTTYVEGGATLIVNNGNNLGKVYSVAADSTLKLGNGVGGYSYGVTVSGAGTAATTGLYLNGGQNYVFSSSLNLLGAPTTIRTYGTGNASLGGFDYSSNHLVVADTASGSVIASTVNFGSGSFGYVMNVAEGANTATGDLTINGVMSGNNSSSGATPTGAGFRVEYQVNRSGVTGSVLLTGASTYSTGMWVHSGSIILSGGDNRLPTASSLALGDGANNAQLVLNGISQTLAAVFVSGTGTGNAVVGGSSTTSTLTLSNASNTTYAGMIGGVSANANNIGLTKAGAGTLTVTGNNTYTGSTVVSAGALEVGSAGVGSTGSGAVTVQTGSTILGTGSVHGSSFTAQSGSTVYAGDGTAQANYGTLSFTPVSGSGSFNFQSGSSVILGINPGGTGDLLSFNGLTAGTLLFNGNLQVTASGYTPTSVQTFKLLDWSNLSTITFASEYSSSSYTGYLLGNGDDNKGFDLPDISASGYAWDISQFTTNGTISTVLLVPEPSRVLLFMAAGFVLIMRRRPAWT